MTTIIDGRRRTSKITGRVRETARLKKETGVVPGLVVIGGGIILARQNSM